MGKPFMSELHQLEATYSAALSMDTSSLDVALSESLRYPLVAVGSGGSLSAAHFACRLHQQFAGKLAKASTPLEILSLLSDGGSRHSLVNSTVLCLSAGGSNTDINRAFRALIEADVCSFISNAVYDGRLLPEPENEKQALVLNKSAHPALKPYGVQYLPVEHDGCSQSSEEEAEAIKEIFESLLKQQYRDKHGKTHKMSHRNILVVAPYNMQVNLLKRVLPDGARVGTVDKFQGQEAEVVIVSMTTTSEEYLPRHIEFLYSKNRLNVALSRARCLSILVANPLLMSIKCKTIDQMALVNTLCWVRDYSELSD